MPSWQVNTFLNGELMLGYLLALSLDFDWHSLYKEGGR
jgi:hypothetical protein